MSEHKITIDRDTYFPGDTVRGQVVVSNTAGADVWLKYSCHDRLTHKLTSDSSSVSYKVLAREIFKLSSGSQAGTFPFQIAIPLNAPGSLDTFTEKFTSAITHRLQAIVKLADGISSKVNLPLTIRERPPAALVEARESSVAASERVGRGWLCFKPLKGWDAQITIEGGLNFKRGDKIQVKVKVTNTSKYPVGPFFLSFSKKLFLVTAVEVTSQAFPLVDAKIEKIQPYSEFAETLSLEIPSKELEAPSYGFHTQLVYCVTFRHEANAHGSAVPVHLITQQGSELASFGHDAEVNHVKMLVDCYGLRLANFKNLKLA